MKVIYRGGYNMNDPKSVKDSMFYEYSDLSKRLISESKKVVFVNFAKPDGYYDSLLRENYEQLPNVIDARTANKIDWGSYDLIQIPGGNTKILKSRLMEYEFNVQKLKKDVLIIGDSAGAYVMSKYFLNYDMNDLKSNIEEYLVEGLNPNSNLLTVAHIDNPSHVDKQKLDIVAQLAVKLNVELLLLKENEAKTMEIYA